MVSPAIPLLLASFVGSEASKEKNGGSPILLYNLHFFQVSLPLNKSGLA